MKAWALALALLIALPCLTGASRAAAQAALVDAHAEVAAALFAASATQAAVEKAADAKLSARRAEIAALADKVRAGRAKQAQLAAAQDGFLAQLAAKDRAYAAEIAVFRGAVTDIAATPDGAAALAKFNQGDEIGALTILDQLRAADDRMRQTRADLESAAEARRIAELALEARARGKLATQAVIARYEEVVKLDPGVFDDWIQLDRLYQSAGRLDDALKAAQTAAPLAASDRDRNLALGELGDVLTARGDLASASKAFAQALAVDQRLAGADPTDLDLQHDLAVGLDRMGDAQRAQGDLAAAARSYADSLAILRTLAAAAPARASLRADVASSLDAAGDIAKQQGDLAGAGKAYDEALAIMRALSTADPDNTAVQRAVAANLDRTGDIAMARGDRTAALKAYREGIAIIRALALADPSSAALQSDLSVGVAKMTGVLTAQGDLVAARALLKSATGEADATSDEWRLRFLTSTAGGDMADAMLALTVIARSWPDSLAQFPDFEVLGPIQKTRAAPDLAGARFDLMEALNQAHWAPRDRFLGADELWIELTLALLDKGQTDKARAVAAAITGPDAIAQMRVDRRFDPVTTADPARFDVAKAAAGNLVALRQASAAAPGQLEGLNAVAGALLEQGEATEALAVVDDAVARARPPSGGKSPFTDIGQLSWTYDLRARTLLMLGRGDEAIASMTLAAQPSAGGQANVAEQLGLAGLRARLGHPADAEAIVQTIKPETLGGYGRMALEAVEAKIRAGTRDDAGQATILTAMKAHAADAPAILIVTLIDTGDLDGAAQAVVVLLNDPLRRAVGLALLQDGLTPDAAPDDVKRRRTRIIALRQRPDVNAAVDKVGRLEPLPLIAGWVWL